MNNLVCYEHLNYPNEKGQVYCRDKHKILPLDFQRCGKCRLLSGGAQGNGVECYYEDVYWDGAVSPESELARIDSLIRNGIITRIAVRPDGRSAYPNRKTFANGKMSFKIVTYENDDTVCCRFVLGKYNENPMYCFGINPSKATTEISDTTISKVLSIAERHNYDGYVMLNIYPLRSTKLDALPDDYDNKLHERNKQAIMNTVPDNGICVAVWGTAITAKPYFIRLLTEINQITKAKGIKWQCLGRTKEGHPYHPSRLPYNKAVCEDFDLDEYITKVTGGWSSHE